MAIKNKRGWLRIVEASTGILIVAGVLITLYAQQIEVRDLSSEIYNLQIFILDEIADNSTFRNEILSDEVDKSGLDSFVDEKLPANFNFSVKICNLSDWRECGLGADGPASGDVYAEERIISANLTKYSPKKVKLYIWER